MAIFVSYYWMNVQMDQCSDGEVALRTFAIFTPPYPPVSTFTTRRGFLPHVPCPPALYK